MRDGASRFDLEPQEHGTAEEDEAESGKEDDAEDEVEGDGATDDVDEFSPTCFISTNDEDEAEAVACNAIAFIIADTSSATKCSWMVPERRSENIQHTDTEDHNRR